MPSLTDHVMLLSDLGPHLVYSDPEHRDDPRREPDEVASSIRPVAGHDEPGAGVTIHAPAPWRCRCQRDLALDYRDVPGAWAQHAALATGLPAELLGRHMLVAVAGHRPEARCSCGASFLAPEEDALNGDAAVALWAEHVEEAA